MISARFEKMSKGDERQYISISGIAPGDFYKMETGRLGFGNSSLQASLSCTRRRGKRIPRKTLKVIDVL
jgi:hypothetical protein